MDNVFVIGDTHGHLDRLEALLKQEGLVDRCEGCDGAGLIPTEHTGAGGNYEVDCDRCDGDGWERKRPDVTVVHVGDLGHFGHRGSPTGDMLCYKYVTVNHWCDVVLWGNHDRAAIDGAHHATDFMQVHEALHFIRRLWEEGRMQVAFAAHDFLITHAGLASVFQQQPIPDTVERTDAQEVADWLNYEDELYIDHMQTDPFAFEGVNPSALAIVNAISNRRGGRAPTGGILWRDIQEGLYDGVRQIFGHSADNEKHAVRYCWEKGYTRHRDALPAGMKIPPSYCIDIGGKGEMPGDKCLAGIWLPSERIARVDL